MRARLVSRYEGVGGAKNGASASGGGGGGQTRLITSKQGLWYELVPRTVRELNAGRPVHVARLVDEAWAAAMARTSGHHEAADDIMKAFASHLRPPVGLSAGTGRLRDDALGRFDAFYKLVRKQ